MKGFYDYYCYFTDLGELPTPGLCSSLPNELQNREAWRIIKPNIQDIITLLEEGSPTGHWGRGSFAYNRYELSPLRQTLLLLAACLNGEEF